MLYMSAVSKSDNQPVSSWFSDYPLKYVSSLILLLVVRSRIKEH
jgi:hypothetical protein